MDFLEYKLEENIIEELKHPDEATTLERIARAFLITDVMSKQGELVTSVSNVQIFLRIVFCHDG